jgi:hypothetical protein
MKLTPLFSLKTTSLKPLRDGSAYTSALEELDVADSHRRATSKLIRTNYMPRYHSYKFSYEQTDQLRIYQKKLYELGINDVHEDRRHDYIMVTFEYYLDNPLTNLFDILIAGLEERLKIQEQLAHKRMLDNQVANNQITELTHELSSVKLRQREVIAFRNMPWYKRIIVAINNSL